MHRTMTGQTRLALSVLALLGSGLLAPSVARAQTAYKVQPILKVGDMVGGFAISPGYGFYLGPLNDRGQLVVDIGTAASVRPELLLQYAGGQFTPIAGPGLDSPAGKLPADVTFDALFGMNQLGNMVFVAARKGGNNPFGTFLWDRQAKTLTAVVLKGMPAGNNLTFQTGGGPSPAINNFGDMAFTANVRGASGLFFLGRDGQLLPIALPGQELPDGHVISSAFFTSLNDAGIVAFQGAPKGSGLANSAYLWDQSSLSLLATPGMDATGGGKFNIVGGSWVNNDNRSVLLSASLKGLDGPFGLYRFADGTISPLVVPGQEMPGGGRFKGLAFPWGYYAVSAANDAGQHAFEAVLADGSQAAYRLDADGKLSLILKSGANTELGPFTGFGPAGSPNNSFGISLNNRGQLAMTVKIAGGPDTVVLLTPTKP